MLDVREMLRRLVHLADAGHPRRIDGDGFDALGGRTLMRAVPAGREREREEEPPFDGARHER